MRFAGASLPRSWALGSLVRAAQSSGEWPGSRMTLRETCLPGGIIDEVGAIEVFGYAFCGGILKDEALEGGGRTKPLPGRGGAGINPKAAGFNRGGLEDLFIVDGI